MKTSCKQLKNILALGVKKLSPTFVALKLSEIPFFNNFLDLANFIFFNFYGLDDFRNLDNF